MEQLNKQDHYIQQEVNEKAFFEILKQISPELYVLNKILHQEKLSPSVFYKVARQLVNINSGTKYGDIHILIENGVVRFVNGTEKDKVEEPILKLAP